jgi:hypothetical protein
LAENTISHSSMYAFDLEKIKDEQYKDMSSKRIICQFQAQKNVRNIVLHNDILFRLIDNRKQITKRKILNVPVSMISKVLEAFYSHPMNRHFGVQCTLHKIRVQF